MTERSCRGAQDIESEIEVAAEGQGELLTGLTFGDGSFPISSTSLLALAEVELNFFPKKGWQRRNLSGLTTAHRLTAPESEEEGSTSLTGSMSMWSREQD